MTRHLDLSPDPGAAPVARRILSHAWMEVRLTTRNGEQLLLALVIPAAILIASRVWGPDAGWSLSQVAPSVLGLAVWSTTFTSVAITTGFERRYGVLERLAATPLGRSGLLIGKAVAVTGFALVQVLMLAALGLGLGWRPHPSAVGTLVTLASVAAAGIGFVALALTLAGRLRAETTLAVANLIYLAGAVCGLLVPPSAWPVALGPVVRFTATGALGEAMRSWSAGGMPLWTLGVGLGWALVWTLLARRLFRWLG